MWPMVIIVMATFVLLGFAFFFLLSIGVPLIESSLALLGLFAVWMGVMGLVFRAKRVGVASLAIGIILFAYVLLRLGHVALR